MSSDYIKSTKTYSSQRDIVVTERLINDILEYKKFLINSFNYDVTDDTLILTNPLSNKPYSDTYLRRLFYSFVDKANNPRIRMYDLRHTFVATMMNEHVDMYAISNRLGHTNIQTTINTYGHITENLKKDMANKTDKFF